MSSEPTPTRRPVIAFVGSSVTPTPRRRALCIELGQCAIDHGFRMVCGGLYGVMAAVCEGARSSSAWREGDIVGILPGYEASDANPWVDIVIPTGMGYGRNLAIVSMADVVIVIHGGAGTLSELAHAWQLGKPVLAMGGSGGWADRLAGRPVDPLRGEGVVERMGSPKEAIKRACELCGVSS